MRPQEPLGGPQEAFKRPFTGHFRPLSLALSLSLSLSLSLALSLSLSLVSLSGLSLVSLGILI